jgi:hypothetical protein
MPEEASTRFTKRAFAKLRPRRLSKSFNEHRDLAAAWNKVNTLTEKLWSSHTSKSKWNTKKKA